MKLRLRKYNEKDLDRHLELFLMNNVYKRINDKVKSQERLWLKKVINNYDKKRPNFYTIAITLNGKLIGNLVAEKINYKDKTLEIGFWIGKKYWNKGYTTRALNLFLKKIIQKFKPKKIYAYHKIDNLASGKVLEKIGFNFESSYKGIKKYSKSFKY